MSNCKKIVGLIRPRDSLSWTEERIIEAIATVLDQKDAEVQAAFDELSKNIMQGTTAALTEIIKERDERIAELEANSKIMVDAMKQHARIIDRLETSVFKLEGE